MLSVVVCCSWALLAGGEGGAAAGQMGPAADGLAGLGRGGGPHQLGGAGAGRLGRAAPGPQVRGD